MRQTYIVIVAAVLIVCSGFGFFYFMKIIPLKENLTLTQSSVQNYKEMAALTKKSSADGEDNAINEETLPKQPEIESFFVKFQAQATVRQVYVDTITRVNRSQNSSLNANSYTIQLSAKSTQEIIDFICDLEKMERILNITQFSMQTGSQASLSLTLYSAKK